MKILIITQSVDINNPVLGFFHRWIEEFSKKFEKVTVICLEKGESDLPSNVKVLSLGKEGGRSRIKYLFRFYKYIWRERKEYDAVFVHMNQEYVLLGWKIWFILGKKVSLWRNHFSGNFLTSLACRLSHIVYFTSPHSFTAKFKNSIKMPVGIDVDIFSPSPIKSEDNSVLFVGRMSAVKKPLLLIKSLKILIEKGYDIKAYFYGKPGENDTSYFNEINLFLEENNLKQNILFKGAVKNIDLVDVYRKSKILVNLSPDGMFDKGIFEALSCGSLVLVSNSAFKDILPEELICHNPDESMLSSALENILKNESRFKSMDFRSYVVNNHSLESLVSKVKKDLEKND